MALLKMLVGPTPGMEIPLRGAKCILGRHPNCDVRLDDGSVSREHAQLTFLNDRWFVEDLHSRNGTYVNDRLLEFRRPLDDLDELRICDLRFAFHAGAAAGPGVTASGSSGMTMWVDDEGSASSIMSKLDVAGSQSGFRMALRPEAKLRALIEITENLGAALALDEILQKTLDSLFKIFIQADRGFIALTQPDTGRLVTRVVKHRRDDGDTIRISRTIVDQVMEGKQAVLSADAASDERFDMSQSVADFHIRSMMCAPLLDSENHALGVMQIDTIDRRSRFQQEDLDVLAAVARQAAFAVENSQLHEQALRQQRVERDLALAHEVQQGFLPASRPTLPGYEFFDFYESASQLGGDYYDYVPIAGGRLAIVVADVSGKGIPAALLMARLSSEVRYCLASEPSPAQAVERLNVEFIRRGWEDRFVTFSLVLISPAEHRLQLVNAGHLPPLLRSAKGKISALGEDASGVPLGVDLDAKYELFEAPIAPGDMIVQFTDGISEAMNPAGELFGLARLREHLARPARDCPALGQQVLDGVKQFVASRAQSDDMCLVCFGRAAK